MRRFASTHATSAGQKFNQTQARRWKTSLSSFTQQQQQQQRAVAARFANRWTINMPTVACLFTMADLTHLQKSLAPRRGRRYVCVYVNGADRIRAARIPRFSRASVAAIGCRMRHVLAGARARGPSLLRISARNPAGPAPSKTALSVGISAADRGSDAC